MADETTSAKAKKNLAKIIPPDEMTDRTRYLSGKAREEASEPESGKRPEGVPQESKTFKARKEAEQKTGELRRHDGL